MGVLFQNNKFQWCRTCSCGREVVYSSKHSANFFEKYNTKNTCRSCSQEGKKNRLFGHPCPWNKLPRSKNTLKKMSESHLGKTLTDETKRKLSIKKIGNKNSLGYKHSNESKKRMSTFQLKRYSNDEEREMASIIAKIAMHRPDVRKRHIEALHHSKWVKVRTDKGQLELLEKWNRLGFNFLPNYQLKTDTDLFYIDGYDKEKNVVLEYDSKYHQKSSQKMKDSLRQSIIISILNPKRFWRYDSETKTFRNIK